MELTAERIEALAKRAAQAKEMVDENRVYPVVGAVEPDRYVVTHSKGAWYIRAQFENQSYPWVCSCPDWQHRASETLGHCKHVLAVLLYRDVNPPEVSAVRPEAQEQDLEEKIRELYH